MSATLLYHMPGISHIAIDEIAIRKGHKYLTVVMDLHTGRVIFVGDGRGADALDSFWKRLKKSRANIMSKSLRDHWKG